MAGTNKTNPAQPAEFIALRWAGDALQILDQTRLPHHETYIEARTAEAVARAILTMQVRGAPAIGVAAAFAMALAARPNASHTEAVARVNSAAGLLAATRPTARNLFWALERMRAAAAKVSGGAHLFEILENEALAIQMEDFQSCKSIGDFGAALIPQKATLLTHCNAGALATAGWGTALGVVRSAVAQHKEILVLADETRPLLQGARLTAWELGRDNIPVTVIPDSAAAYCIRQGKVDAVIVGADRIARNGDVANKIGTYPLALAAREHGVPFYVAAPLSTVDLSLDSGEEIPIEERSAEEVLLVGETRISAAPQAYNPAFDITPAALIAAIITEKGVLRAPYEGVWPA